MSLKNASVYYGFDTVELENVDKKYNHPTIIGMRDIKNQILNKIIE